MILDSLILLGLLGSVIGSPIWSSYHGPLSPHSTSAPELELNIAARRAAFELEHERLKTKLAADHPDLIPHLADDSYSPHLYERGLQSYDNGEYRPELYEFNSYSSDDGHYDPKLYEEPHISQYDDGQYKPHLYNKGNDYTANYDDGKYRPNLYQQSQYNAPAYRPATLNADGTVAHTPEYKAIAASFLAAYKQALHRHRRSAERYQGPPAPLNHDFTVDFTPEVKHVQAAHFTAVANQFKRLHETAALAAAHPELTFPPSKDYNPQNYHYVPHESVVGKYHPHFTKSTPELYNPHLYHAKHYDDGQYRPHLYEQGHHYTQHPAASNYQHRRRRSAERYEGPPAPLNPDFTVDFTPEIKKVNEAHFSAVASQYKRLQAAAQLAAAHPDRTSPPSQYYKPNDQQ